MTRTLGIDMGQRRIGVAVSDSLGITAQPVGVVARTTPQADLATLSKLAAEHAVSVIVIGLPLTLQGTRGPQAQRVEAFGRALSTAAGVPVAYVDERFTTAEGQRALRAAGASERQQRPIIDRVAAQLILQQYLDMHRP